MANGHHFSSADRYYIYMVGLAEGHVNRFAFEMMGPYEATDAGNAISHDASHGWRAVAYQCSKAGSGFIPARHTNRRDFYLNVKALLERDDMLCGGARNKQSDLAYLEEWARETGAAQSPTPETVPPFWWEKADGSSAVDPEAAWRATLLACGVSQDAH